MAVSKAIPANDIINGLAVVMTGEKKTQLYDNTQRTQHLPTTNVNTLTVISGRYLKHGGPGGSGSWEH